MKQQRCSHNEQISVSVGTLVSLRFRFSGHAMEVGNACVQHWISVSGGISMPLRFGFSRWCENTYVHVGMVAVYICGWLRF